MKASGFFLFLIGSLFGFSAGRFRVNIQTEQSYYVANTNSTTHKSHVNTNNSTTLSSTIYGLLHMAKVAGTEINGELALRFRNVCGNKGWSFDAYQSNMRHHVASTKHDCHNLKGCIQDSVASKRGLDWNRGRIPFKLGVERGFEDCDYVASEAGYEFWKTHFLPLGGSDIRKELHVPCRKDPVDHLMSMANHGKKTFNCSAIDLKKEVKRCSMTQDRFHNSLKNLGPNNSVKAKQFPLNHI